MALVAERNTPARTGRTLSVGVAAAVVLYTGALVCMTAAGYATPGARLSTLKGLGRARATVDNAEGAAGDVSAEIETGIFRFDNSTGADEITIAERYQVCYVVDDEAVAKTSDGGARGKAGFVVDVDDAGVWVLLGEPLPDALDGGLLAVNNLSDIVSAATARGNIGANKINVPVNIANLVGGDAAVYGFVAPCAGTISKLLTNLRGHALATGDATVTAAINGAAVTGGVVTIAQDGSAVGDKDSATPSALNVVAEGDYVSFTVGGTNDNAAAFAGLTAVITF